MSYYGGGWPKYVSVAERRAKAAKHVKKLKRKGQRVEPVEIEGRKITKNFWGEAWCDHVESLADFASRIGRGRTYVRNGSVIHLGIEGGKIEALISGSTIYKSTISIDPLPQAKWEALKAACVGKVGSLLELMQGKLSEQVMEVVTHKRTGLFPAPSEIRMQCNCPDWADLCKHLAAVFYGIGHRLDSEPQLLFTLRGVDPEELIESADFTFDDDQPTEDALADDMLGDIFGIDIDVRPTAPPKTKKKLKSKKKATSKKKSTSKKKAIATKKKSTSKKKATAAKKKSAPKKATAKKATAKKKAAAKKSKTTTKKATSKKATAKKKATSKKTTAKKKATSKKATTKKAVSKKTTAKKTTAVKKKATSKKKATTAKKAATEKAPALRIDREHPRGEDMQVLRQYLGYTLKQMGNAMGVTTHTIKRWENTTWRIAFQPHSRKAFEHLLSALP